MTINIQDRKLRLIQRIAALDDEQTLSGIEAQLNSNDGATKDVFKDIIKPTRQQLTVADLIKEQNYTPISKEKFYEKVEKLNIEEPLEDLLSMLTK